MLQTYSDRLSETGRQALSAISKIVLTIPGVAELVEKSAREIALFDDEQAAQELKLACEELEQHIRKLGILSDTTIRGSLIAMSDMIVVRREKLRASWGRG